MRLLARTPAVDVAEQLGFTYLHDAGAYAMKLVTEALAAVQQ